MIGSEKATELQPGYGLHRQPLPESRNDLTEEKQKKKTDNN
jgi:hypothetical protein